MHVTDKGQVTIPKRIRLATGVLPGSEVTFAIEAGKIVISKLASAIQTDRREQLRAAAAKVRQSMSPDFKQLDAADVMAFLRSDEPTQPQAHVQPPPVQLRR
jgi:AbrB family looped-hinge helix DNA binding protein